MRRRDSLHASRPIQPLLVAGIMFSVALAGCAGGTSGPVEIKILGTEKYDRICGWEADVMTDQCLGIRLKITNTLDDSIDVDYYAWEVQLKDGQSLDADALEGPSGAQAGATIEAELQVDLKPDEQVATLVLWGTNDNGDTQKLGTVAL